MSKFVRASAIGYTILIIVASLGRFVMGVFPKGVAHSDKIGHFVAYAGFAFVWGVYFVKVLNFQLLKSSRLVFLWSVSFGVLMECCQWVFTSYRQFDYYDMLANTVGSLLGLLVFRVFFAFIKKRQL